MNSKERADQYLDSDESLWDQDRAKLAVLFNQHAEEAKAEQRQMCAKKVTKLYVSTKGDVCWRELADACLNATGESDVSNRS